MLRRLFTYLWYAGASLLVLAALSLSIARLALPMLEVPESQLAGWVRETVGHDVQIGRLDLAWRGWGPELRMYAVELTEPQSRRSVLSADEFRIGVDLWSSLWTGRLQPARLVLIGSELSLLRDADGQLAVEGIHIVAPDANPWLIVLAQPRVELRDLRVHWRDASGQFPDASFDAVDLRLVNRGTRHQLQLYLGLPEALGESLHLAADLRGPPERLRDWQGELYVDVKQAPLAAWLQGRLPGGLVPDGRLDARLWSSVKQGRADHVIGEVSIDAPVVHETHTHADTQTTQRQLFQAQHIDGQVEWRRAKSGWTLNLDRIRLTDQEDLWRESGMTVAVSDQDDGHQVQFSLTYLRLETVLPWLAHLMQAAPQQHELLERMQIGGAVQALQLAFNTRGGRIQSLAYQLRFDDLHSSPVERIPGSSGLSGRLIGTHERGVLELDSRSARALLPNLFREPLALDTLAGDLRWRRLPDRLRIESRELHAANADIQTQTRLRLDIPYDGSEAFLDMQTDFSGGRIADAYKYLPVGIMPPATVTWLDRALVSGRVDSGALLFHGRLGEFPFDAASGRMEVRANVSDAVLDYHPDWHRIERLDAELAFVNRAMSIQGRSGAILGAELQDVDVRIADLAHAQLEIKGQARGPLADMLRYLRDSPLGADMAGRLGDVEAAGAASLALELSLPLAEARPTRLQGRVQLAGNSLALPEYALAFEAMQGELQFTENSIAASGVQAQLLNTPVQLDVATVKPDAQRVTHVDVRGRLPLLQRLQDNAKPWAQRVSGTSQWHARLILPQAAQTPAQLQLRSKLEGIAVDLPAPLGKAAGSARDFDMRVDLTRQGARALHLGYGPHSAALLFDAEAAGSRLLRGQLQLGGRDAVLPDSPGLFVQGHLDELPLDAWRALLKDTGGDAPRQAVFDVLQAVDLSTGQVQLFDRRFHAVRIDAEREAAAWRLRLAGPTTDGVLTLPDDPALAVHGELARLHIPAAAGGNERARLHPADLPALVFNCADLQFHDLQLGRVTLHTRQLPDGVQVERLQVESDWLKMQTQGNWTRHAEQDASRFKIELQGGELGRLLSTFGYAGSVEGGPTYGEIEANWPGTPADFALPKLEGTLALRIGEGRLLNVETGAGRVFGLFNMQGIRRRLALDFSDVFDKGFSFDRIEGHFTLLDTDAYTNDLVIEGPAARIEISGRTGLARQDYDQVVTVIPQVQSTLPVAGAIAGGPVVGAALLLVERLFSDQMEDLTRFARYQYSVTGSWEEPVFTPIERRPGADPAAQGLQDNDSRRHNSPAPDRQDTQ